ncbi:hypothetical protein JCM5350_004834 [Sporobolomyces pararoseus]
MPRRSRQKQLQADAFRDHLCEVIQKYEAGWSEFNLKLIDEKDSLGLGYDKLGLGALLRHLDARPDLGERTARLRSELHELHDGRARLLIIKRLQDALNDFEGGPELLTVDEFNECLSCVDEIVGGAGPAPSFPDSELYAPVVQNFWSYSGLALDFARNELENPSLGGYSRVYRGRSEWQTLPTILPKGFRSSSQVKLNRKALLARNKLYQTLREYASEMRGINAPRRESDDDAARQIQGIVAKYRAKINTQTAHYGHPDSTSHSASIAHVPVSRPLVASTSSIY